MVADGLNPGKTGYFIPYGKRLESSKVLIGGLPC